MSPDYYYRTIGDIDFAQLKARGIDTLLLDLDNTLLPRNDSTVPEDLRKWIADVRGLGFNLCIVSNNWHGHVLGIARDLGLDIVSHAIKPLPFAFSRALKRLGSSASRAAVIGDQMFTDILGGKLLGATTILVLPVSRNDLPHMFFLRRLERILLAGKHPLP